MSSFLTLLAAEKGNGFWLPADLWEVFWGTISFLVVVALLVKFTKAPAAKYFAGRIKTITADLAAAESARTDAETERDQVKAALADSESEKGRIIGEAEASAQVLRGEAASRAAADADRVRVRAQSDLAASRAQVQSDLSGELARLSLGAAESVVESSLDEATQQQLIDSYINQVGSQN